MGLRIGSRQFSGTHCVARPGDVRKPAVLISKLTT